MRLTEEQDLLVESLSRFLEREYPNDARRKIVSGDEGWSVEAWRKVAELGVLGATAPESLGGFSGSAALLTEVSRLFGEYLFLEPFFPSAVLASQALQAVGGSAAQSALESLYTGERIYALAYDEPEARGDFLTCKTLASEGEGGFRLNGEKCLVLGGPIANELIVSASFGASLNLFLVKADAPGVAIEPYKTIDGRLAANIRFTDVSVARAALLSSPGEGEKALEAAIGFGIVSLAGEASGLCRKMCQLTAEYCLGREQFGQPIANFQALQHRLADMEIAAQQVDALSFKAAVDWDSRAEDLSATLCAAKAEIGSLCRGVGEGGIQLHGAMGMTDEMEIGQYFKRGLALGQLLGDRDFHLRRYQTLSAA